MNSCLALKNCDPKADSKNQEETRRSKANPFQPKIERAILQNQQSFEGF